MDCMCVMVLFLPNCYARCMSLSVDVIATLLLLRPLTVLTSSCVSSRRMLRWCVTWSAVWRTRSLTLPSCSPPWCVCGPTQESRSVSAAPESTSSTIQRSSTYSTCAHLFVCVCVSAGWSIQLLKSIWLPKDFRHCPWFPPENLIQYIVTISSWTSAPKFFLALILAI